MNLKAFVGNLVAVCIVALGFSSDYSKGDFCVSNLRTLSIAAPQIINIYGILTIIAILVVIVACIMAWFLKRRRKLIAIVAVALISVMVVAGVVWYMRVSIYYSFDALYTYPRGGDNYFTLNCQNTGYVQGSFSLIVKLENASVSTKTSQPFQQLDSSGAKFNYTLQPKEKQSTDVYFTINDNVVGFKISLSFQSIGDFLITSDSANYYSFLNFVKEPFDDNFTSQMSPPPP